MFSSLKKLFHSSEPQENNHDAEAAVIMLELSELEALFTKNPVDNDTQKKLMVKYNQAIKVFASCKDYRHHVDDIFIKIDNLRNTIRKNI